VVHHADLDLDASTAVRFHFGELANLPERDSLPGPISRLEP